MPSSDDSFVITPLLPMREEVVFPRSTSPFGASSSRAAAAEIILFGSVLAVVLVSAK